MKHCSKVSNCPIVEQDPEGAISAEIASSSFPGRPLKYPALLENENKRYVKKNRRPQDTHIQNKAHFDRMLTKQAKDVCAGKANIISIIGKM